MILLDTNTDLKITLDTTPSAQLDWNSTFVDTVNDTVGGSRGQTDSANDVIVVSSPSSDERLVKYLNIHNNSSDQVQIVIKTDDGVNQRTFVNRLLNASNTIIYDSYLGWHIFTYQAGSSINSLSQLSDTDVSSPNNQQLLTYNAETAKWEPADPTYGDTPWEVISSNTTLDANKGYLIDCSSAPLSVSLPSNPLIGDTLSLKDFTENAGTNNITLERNGNNIEGSASDFIIDTDAHGMHLVYSGSTWGWTRVYESHGPAVYS